MITFQSERWFDILDELKPLLVGQWRELGLYQDQVPMDMDWDRYRVLDTLGMLKITTGRDGGRLIGWYVSVVTPHLHYRTTTYGYNDFYYLIPEYRTGLNGMQLFMAMEKSMRELGVDALISISKTLHPVDAVFERLGWNNQGTTYMKVLKEIA